ncbi:RIB43A-like with coiled-coils protein 2 [Gracilinanus agilis]|uniref:RIB43A-like with coiled-coils protein 2 n=1 Tax=Gracilinanus agilis TaxID=191870 RepID=UPI001CFCC9AC|nr:RIB43A-like with coiled-coils protein 2 [Gracilinanus agilis]
MPGKSRSVVQLQDHKTAFALAKRRQAEVLLQSRLFNARERLMGGDYEAWKAQVHDRKIQNATEKGRHETIGAEMRQNDRIACILEERQKRDRKTLQKAITEFRQTFQKPESRREFDLSDPLALKKDTTPSILEEVKKNSVSGMQRFMGEDLGYNERKKAQQEQNREWTLEHQHTWNNALADHKLAEDIFTKSRLEFDQTAMDLQKLELATRRAVCAVVKDFNKNQILEATERRRLEHKQEEEDNVAEIANTLQSDFPSETSHRLGQGRRWTKEQLEEIWLIQKQQIHEKQRLQEEEKQRDFDWDRQRVQAARVNILLERKQQRLNRDLRRDMDNKNLNLAYEHKSMTDYLNEEVYRNYPSAEYFSQFNTTSK